MANSYLAGALVRVATYSGSISTPTGGFQNSSGVLTDPVTVTLKYQPGAGQPFTTVIYPATPIAKDGTGLYHADLDTTGSGDAVWSYIWEGVGGVQAIAGSAFIVRDPYS